MTAIQKRFLFCACGGAIGATLAFEFQAWWWLISAISALTGWISADYTGFYIGLRKVLSCAVKEVKAKSEKIFRKPASAKNPEISYTKLGIALMHILAITMLAAYLCFGVLLSFTLVLPTFVDVGYLLSPTKLLVEMAIVSILSGIVIGLLITTPIFYAGILLENQIRDEYSDCKACLHFCNPIVFVPTVTLTSARFIIRYLVDLIKMVHSDERTVYAICFAGGTVAGFIAGRQFEVSHVGGLVAMSVGALVGFSLAWLDWKVLSIKLGWRAVKN